MSKKPPKFYTSDLHFLHNNILKLRSCFSTIEEHDALIIKRMNQSIPDRESVLYILGDLAMGASYEQLADRLSQIRCKKIVIQGNHDRPTTLQRLKHEGVICNWHFIKGTTDIDIPVFMSHFPLADAHSGDKQRLLLHGHSHGLLQHNNYFMHDVGVDAHHYYPFTIDWLDRERLLEKLNSTSERGTRCSYMLSHKPEEVQ